MKKPTHCSIKYLGLGLVLVLLCGVSPSFACGGGGGGGSSTNFSKLEGKVKDDQGKLLKDVKVALASVDLKASPETWSPSCEQYANKKPALTASTGSNGQYRFGAVRPGTYSLCYGLEGHQSLLKQIALKRGPNVLDIRLSKVASAESTQATNDQR